MTNTAIVNSTIIDFNKPLDAIFVTEEKFLSQINNAAKEIIITDKKIIMVAGPSGSGKTTFSKMLSKKLEDFGYHTIAIEMDNYFKTFNPEKYPKTNDGRIDLEHPDCLDAELLHNDLTRLLNKKKIYLPHYDFVNRVNYISDELIVPTDNTIFIIEGIHALNPKFSEGLDVFKIYINTNSRFNIYNTETKSKIIIDRRMERCFRRSIRDKNKRGTTISETLDMWDIVVGGELKYVNIYKNEADVLIDSSLPYEPFMLIPMFANLCTEEEAKKNEKLYNIINYFKDMPSIDLKYLPKSSLLNEFLSF